MNATQKSRGMRMEMRKGHGLWRSRPFCVKRGRQIASEADAKGNGTSGAGIGVGDEAGSVDPMDFGDGNRPARGGLREGGRRGGQPIWALVIWLYSVTH